ncbi:Putative protein of unknown function [Podospora comata]|uniref:Uncharacterized protein n=1 Tax=Podospora comata TaxID=48703 RepID=A0ABY6RV43_PODCO|nr:Putative protein of unknown function [Podospora comata]
MINGPCLSERHFSHQAPGLCWGQQPAFLPHVSVLVAYGSEPRRRGLPRRGWKSDFLRECPDGSKAPCSVPRRSQTSQQFLDIFRRDNEIFRNSMHQDAHDNTAYAR